MRCVHVTALACALVAIPVASRADVILVSGTIASFSSEDPALAGLHLWAFTATGTFTPEYYDKYGVQGTYDWTFTLAGGATLTLTSALPASDIIQWPVFNTNSLDFLPGHVYWFNTHVYSASNRQLISFDTEIHVSLAPSFVYTPPPQGFYDSDHIRDYLLSDLAIGNVLPRSGTINFSRGDGAYLTSFSGTVTHLDFFEGIFAVPEPATLAAALVGTAALALVWARGRGRPGHRFRVRAAQAQEAAG